MPKPASATARALRPSDSAPLFAALGERTRLRLLSSLGEHGPMSITRLTARTRVTRQAVTKHLQLMRAAGLVRGARRGRESIWKLSPERLEDAHRYLNEISQQWDAALGRLKHFVEE